MAARHGKEVIHLRAFGSLADRMLSVVAPKITAAAVPCHGCTLDYCYCSGGVWYGKLCCLTTECTISCSACLRTTTAC